MNILPVSEAATTENIDGFRLVELSPQTSKLLNMVVTTPGLFEKIGNNREAFFSIFGDNLNSSDRRALELLAEVFLPDGGPAVPLVYNGCSCWTWMSA